MLHEINTCACSFKDTKVSLILLQKCLLFYIYISTPRLFCCWLVGWFLKNVKAIFYSMLHILLIKSVSERTGQFPVCRNLNQLKCRYRTVTYGGKSSLATLRVSDKKHSYTVKRNCILSTRWWDRSKREIVTYAPMKLKQLHCQIQVLKLGFLLLLTI